MWQCNAMQWNHYIPHGNFGLQWPLRCKRTVAPWPRVSICWPNVSTHCHKSVWACGPWKEIRIQRTPLPLNPPPSWVHLSSSTPLPPHSAHPPPAPFHPSSPSTCPYRILPGPAHVQSLLMHEAGHLPFLSGTSQHSLASMSPFTTAKKCVLPSESVLWQHNAPSRRDCGETMCFVTFPEQQYFFNLPRI